MQYRGSSDKNFLQSMFAHSKEQLLYSFTDELSRPEPTFDEGRLSFTLCPI